MRFPRRALLQGAAALPLAAQVSKFVLNPGVTRPWISGDFWTNPLQDWQLANGRIECIVSGGDRNVFLLTRQISNPDADFSLSVQVGPLDTTAPSTPGFVGFRIGSRGYFNDYRDSAIRGVGVDAGMSTDGRLFIAELTADAPKVPNPATPLTLSLSTQQGAVTLQAVSANGAVLATLTRPTVPAPWLLGGIALVCHAGPIVNTPPRRGATDTGFDSRRGTARQGNVRFWFQNLTVSGPAITTHPERAFGPLLFNQYTVTRGTLKMGVQCAPIEAPNAQVELQVHKGNTWSTAAKAAVEPMSAVALLRVETWNASADTPYRVLMNLDGQVHQLTGAIAHDPREKNRLVIGALTCQNDLGFPHSPIFKNLAHLQPDVLFFTGDQIYERSGDYGNQITPAPAARLDYLRKWFLFGWSWRELTRNIPTLCLPDDHDVYHGNIWGAGGRRAEGQGQPGQDSGGYKMPAAWVNMVERTQCAHMPDPPDFTPIEQNIAVHYCHFQWGGISFAMLEDRKWKSAPKQFLPKAQIVNGWPQNPEWNAERDGDVLGAQLLGPRQENFLEEWARDWSDGTFLKAVISATIYCNLATLPAPANTDAVTTRLPMQEVGGYGEGEIATMDHDSNAWPPRPRLQALRSFRRALAFHVSGDQHLGSTLQYGIDTWNDGPFALCTPAISNIFPRRWFPPQSGRNPLPHSPRNTGEYKEGFGNMVTVHAVANPVKFGVAPAVLTERAPGFGVIEVFRDSRQIIFTNWPYWADLTKPNAKPYAGWPVTINQFDNGLPKTGWTLPAVQPDAGPPPVIEVINEATKELVYCFRLRSGPFTPPVPGPGAYTIRLFDPDGKFVRTLTGQAARKA